MKKLLMMSLLLMTSSAFADSVSTVNRTSFTQTSESGYIAANRLDHILIGAASTNGSITVCNSTWTCTGTVISSISLGTVFTYDYSDLMVTGIFYTTKSNSQSGVSIIYKK